MPPQALIVCVVCGFLPCVPSALSHTLKSILEIAEEKLLQFSPTVSIRPIVIRPTITPSCGKREPASPPKLTAMLESHQYSLLLFPQEALSPNIITINQPRFSTALKTWKTCSQFGFDIETFSKTNDADGALNPETGEIRLIQIAIPQNPNINVLVIDLGWTSKERSLIHQKLETLGFWDTLKEKLASHPVEVVGHSLDFEQRWMLSKYNYPIRNIRDTKLMSQVYWAGLDPWLDKRHGKPHSLESICLRLGLDIDKTQQTSDWGWGELGNGQLSNSQLNYAGYDAEVVLKIHERLEPLLKDIGVWDSYLIECGASPAFAQMSHYGMPVDEAVLADVTCQYEAAYQSLLDQLKCTFDECIPHLYSPKKLAALINRQFELNLTSAKVDDLSKFWTIPELRLISIIKTTKVYVDYLQNIKSNVTNGYTQGNYTQINRKGFGRSSCSDPNLQNPPSPSTFPPELKPYNLPPIRSVFRTHPGRVGIWCDASKLHARVATQASLDPELMTRFNSAHGDIFCSIAEKIAQLETMGSEWTEENIRVWDKDKNHPNHPLAARLRAMSKSVHYGSQNLQGFRTLQNTIRTKSGIILSDSSAKNSITAWKTTYKVLAKFQRQIIQDANNCLPTVLGIESICPRTKFGLGYVRCLTGRGVFLPKWPQKYSAHRELSVRGPDANAAYWTMCEADIIKTFLAYCIAAFDTHPEWEAWVGNCCHDEGDLFGKEEFGIEIASAVQNAMRQAMRTVIKDIPVDEGENPKSLLGNSWTDK